MSDISSANARDTVVAASNTLAGNSASEAAEILRSDEYKKRKKYYLRWFAAAFVVTTFYLILNIPELLPVLRRFSADLAKPFSELYHLWNDQTATPQADAATLLVKINKNLHPAPVPLMAFLQIASVILLSVLWFQAFILRSYSVQESKTRNWPVLLSLLPAMGFAVGMYQSYQPAVFVMALVAIYVAAEHFGSLEAQQQVLKKQQGNLAAQKQIMESQKGILQTQQRSLTTQQQDLNAAVKSIEKVAVDVGMIVRNMGLEKFIGLVYGAYAKATTISAVVRFHDIDGAWWAFGKHDDPWPDYIKTIKERPNPLTLINALGCKREGSGQGLLWAHFVADLPLPLSAEWKSRFSAEKHWLFQDIVGLAWQLEVMGLVREQAKNQEIVRAWIARPLSWIHVTNRELFQIIRKKRILDSSVQILVSEEDFNSEDVFVSNLNRNLFEWAEADIERYAERGCPAEEYIFSLLRWALLKVEVRDPRELYGNENLERALDELGLGGWLSQGSSDKECEAAGSKDRVRHLCLGIFTRLIERSLHDDICALKFSGKARLVEHLAYEVL